VFECARIARPASAESPRSVLMVDGRPALRLQTRHRREAIHEAGGRRRGGSANRVVAGDSRTRLGRGEAASMQHVGDVEKDHVGPLGATPRSNVATSQSFAPAQRGRHATLVEMQLDRGARRCIAATSLVAQFRRRLRVSARDEAPLRGCSKWGRLARVRYFRTSGDVRQRKPGPGARSQALRVAGQSGAASSRVRRKRF